MLSEKELFEAYREDVYKTCYYMLQNAFDAEDTCQEVFITVFKHDWRRVKYVKAWLIKIAVNQCLNLLRKNKQWKLKEDRLMQQRSLMMEKSAESVLLEQEAENEFIKLIGTLSVKIRTVILLRFLHDYSHKEISEIIGIPIGTVKSRLNRGMKIIRKTLVNHDSQKEGIVYERHV